MTRADPKNSFIDVVFDGPPGPEAGRFVELENSRGESISPGEWVHRPDGYWALRLPSRETYHAERDALAARVAELEALLAEVAPFVCVCADMEWGQGHLRGCPLERIRAALGAKAAAQ